MVAASKSCVLYSILDHPPERAGRVHERERQVEDGRTTLHRR
jgi:hypothetical protein